MTNVLRSAVALTATALLLSATGCASQRLLGNPQSPYPPATPPRIGDVLHTRTGLYLDEARMFDAATDSRIVYVGETHDNPASHRLQLDLLKTLQRRYPGRTALAMEMFTPSQQPTLDGWVDGSLAEKELLRRWYNGWRMDFGYYREILDFARANRIPVLGINAEKQLVQAVGRKELTELTAEEQAQLPTGMDFSDPYQTALTKAIFGGHNAGGKQFAGFHRIQTLWDETMAENIARFLSSPQGDDYHLLVLAGDNHIRNGFGIPRRVFRRLPLSYVLVGNEELEVSEKKKAEAYMDVTLPVFPMPAYDFVVYTRYEDLPPQPGVKLGVMLGDHNAKIVVNGVLPGSAGEQAGLQKGDILVAGDGTPLTESFDLIYALKQKSPGDRLQLDIVRDGTPLSLAILFPKPPATP